MPQTKKSGRRSSGMTDAHKAALAAGRDDARHVKRYLEALEAVTPRKRGRRRTPESIDRRLAAIDGALETAGALARVQLLQEQADLRAERAALAAGPPEDLEALRLAFVKAAKSYSTRKGISYATWRAVGVDAATLKEAGITRAS